MISQRAIDAIEVSDVDELIRVVDGLCENEQWDDLVELKLRCRESVGRGKQLWGVEEHIRYRLALEAPGPWAGAAVSEGVARFALGPLPEVAASTKTWAELEPHLDDGPWRAVTAAERVVRGDEETGEIADLPNRLMDWEPDYPVATYKSDKVETPSPPLPSVEKISVPDDYEVLEDPPSEGALYDLVQPWVNESSGRYETAVVTGSAVEAIRALGLTRARMGPISARDALRWMAWAAASGGAHGRRRGAAAGRYGARGAGGGRGGPGGRGAAGRRGGGGPGTVRRMVGGGHPLRPRLAARSRRDGSGHRETPLLLVRRRFTRDGMGATTRHRGPGRGVGLGDLGNRRRMRSGWSPMRSGGPDEIRFEPDAIGPG